MNGHTHNIEIPQKAYDAIKEEVADFKMDGDTTEHVTNMALLIFAGYIDAATSMSESYGGGGTAPSSGWGKNDDDEWEWAKYCAQLAHSMVTTPKARTRHGRGR